MAKLDIYRLADGTLLLDCQADLLSGLNTRIVAPLIAPESGGEPLTRLNPLFQLDGQTFVMATQFLGSVPLRELGSPIATLHNRESEVSAALDMLFVGF